MSKDFSINSKALYQPTSCAVSNPERVQVARVVGVGALRGLAPSISGDAMGPEMRPRAGGVGVKHPHTKKILK